MSDYHFELPDSLIAAFPVAKRSDSRLLWLTPEGSTQHLAKFANLVEVLNSGDLLVLNDTRVIPARLYGHKSSGGKIEILIERLLSASTALVHLRASKSPKRDSELFFASGAMRARVIERQGDLYHLQFDTNDLLSDLTTHGIIPLPLYIKRASEALDRERYQTVYAQISGSVAAPTAGLHFDEELLANLALKGVKIAYLTLHVGAGTFQNIRENDLSLHRMHSELCTIPASTCQLVNETRKAGGRVIAVGTTSVRALETATDSEGQVQPIQADTNLFIRPGYEFRAIDGMITNFHLPGTTLLMLVSALVGRERLLAAYQEAIAHQYRFYSYGDSMLITRR